jgi:plasmid maintenance system antidote protein VapI
MSTPLAEWLDRQDITQFEFGRRLGRTQAWVSRISSGERRITLEAAVQIERATGGAVPASAWIERLNS